MPTRIEASASAWVANCGTSAKGAFLFLSFFHAAQLRTRAARDAAPDPSNAFAVMHGSFHLNFANT